MVGALAFCIGFAVALELAAGWAAVLVGTFTALAAALGLAVMAGAGGLVLAAGVALAVVRDVVGGFGLAGAFIAESLLLPQRRDALQFCSDRKRPGRKCHSRSTPHGAPRPSV